MSKLSASQKAPPSRVLSHMGLCYKILQRPRWLGPTPTLWGMVSLSNGQVLAYPRKHSCGHAVAEVQRLWQITTHSTRFHCTLVSLSQYQQMWLLSAVHWNHCLWESHMASIKCILSRGTSSPCATHGPLRPCCLLLGIRPTFSPEHHQALSSGTLDSALHCL